MGALIGAGIPEHRAKVYGAGFTRRHTASRRARSEEDADKLEELWNIWAQSTCARNKQTTGRLIFDLTAPSAGRKNLSFEICASARKSRIISRRREAVVYAEGRKDDRVRRAGQRVFDLFSDFENFPRWIRHIRHVSYTGGATRAGVPTRRLAQRRVESGDYAVRASARNRVASVAAMWTPEAE